MTYTVRKPTILVILSIICLIHLTSCAQQETKQEISVVSPSYTENSNSAPASDFTEVSSTEKRLETNDLVERKQERNENSDRAFSYWSAEVEHAVYAIEKGNISTKLEALEIIQTMEDAIAQTKLTVQQDYRIPTMIWVIEQDFVFGRSLTDSYVNEVNQIVTNQYDVNS